MVNFAGFLVLLLLGRLFIHLWMEFPLPEWVDNGKFGKLHTCRLCSGVWIYSAIFIFCGIDLVSLIGASISPIVGGILSGGAISYLMDIMEIGFRERYMSIIIE